MEHFLVKYSIQEILIFSVLLFFAIRQFMEAKDWIQKEAHSWANKDEALAKIEQKAAEERNLINKKLDEALKEREVYIKRMDERDDFLQKEIEAANENIKLLLESDRDDIKAWITREHNYFCNKLGEIDTYSLDCINRRYQHYVKEKGNSFIEDLMNEIKALPKVAPSDIKQRDRKKEKEKGSDENNGSLSADN